MEQIDVAFCCDDTYADKMAVTMLSIAENTEHKLNFYVVDCGISDTNKQLACSLLPRYNNIEKIIFKEVIKNKIIEKFPCPKQFPQVVFYRFFIPSLFPEIERVIYLDCDIIVCGNIAALWNLDLKSSPLGAISEDTCNFQYALSQRKAKLNMPDCQKYFNAGVLLIDCESFAKHEIWEKIVDHISHVTHMLRFPEQDVMNILFSTIIAQLPVKFNMIVHFPYVPKVIKQEKPVVLHYSIHKPWNMNRDVVCKLHKWHIDKIFTELIMQYWIFADKILPKQTNSKNARFTYIAYRNKFFNKICYFKRELIFKFKKNFKFHR